MSQELPDPIAEWNSIVASVRGVVAGISEGELGLAVSSSVMSPRALVHHVVEANVVAASIVIAALGSPGCTYDWSWLVPNGEWHERLDYEHKPIGPALALLEALNAYVVAQVVPLADGLSRTVLLRDAPGAETYARTVAQILLQEAEHARMHIAESGRAK